MIKVKLFLPIQFGSNCYLLFDDISKDSYIIDPSVNVGEVRTFLKNNNLNLSKILITHSHFDHLLSVDSFYNEFGCEVLVHSLDAPGFTNPLINASSTFGGNFVFKSPYKQIMDGERISFGDNLIKTIHTPGHTVGSVCYLVNNMLFTGDLLFANGYGRTDLYGGDYVELVNSLHIINNLPDDLLIYPGHGEMAELKNALNNVF